jgi:anti-sigma factor RsiW
MTCREFIEFLSDYVDGALPSGQRHFFDEHMAGCLDCQTYLESYKRTVRLGKLALADGDGAVPDDVPEALVQAILSARRATGR